MKINDNNYTVYRHFNKVNGKQYIGITKRPLKQRWGENGSGYGSSTYFASAIKHYGWDNFEHEILFENLSKEEACKKEIELIQKYKTTNHTFGYNSTSGGESFTMSDEVRKKMSLSMIGNKNGCVPCSDAKKEKISNALKGKKFTEEHLDNLRKGAKNRKSSPCSTEKAKKISKSHKKKPVICVETNIIYESVQECARQLNIPATNLVKCLKGKIHTAHNLHFKYYNTINA